MYVVSYASDAGRLHFFLGPVRNVCGSLIATIQGKLPAPSSHLQTEEGQMEQAEADDEFGEGLKHKQDAPGRICLPLSPWLTALAQFVFTIMCQCMCCHLH